MGNAEYMGETLCPQYNAVPVLEEMQHKERRSWQRCSRTLSSCNRCWQVCHQKCGRWHSRTHKHLHRGLPNWLVREAYLEWEVALEWVPLVACLCRPNSQKPTMRQLKGLWH